MIEELDIEYRVSMIFLACAIAFIGTHTAVSMSEQFRLALSKPTSAIKIYGIVILSSLSLGGVGFCGTQYIVVQSLRLHTSDHTIIPLQYNPNFVIGSIILTSSLSFFSILIASYDQYFNKSQIEIMNTFLSKALQKNTMAEIKHMGKQKILFRVCTNSIRSVAVGGTLAGGALCISRYTALFGIEFPGVVEHNNGLIALSIILSFIGMILLYWLFFRIVSVFPNYEYLRTICSFIGMIFIACVHYIRIALTKFYYNPKKLTVVLSSNSVDSSDIFRGTVISSILFIFILLSLALWDLRQWLKRLNRQLREAERAIITMIKHPTTSSSMTMNTTPSTISTMTTARDSIRVKEAPIPEFPAPPEVMSYARQYLEPERLPLSFRQQLTHLPVPMAASMQCSSPYNDIEIPILGSQHTQYVLQKQQEEKQNDI